MKQLIELNKLDLPAGRQVKLIGWIKLGSDKKVVLVEVVRMLGD